MAQDDNTQAQTDDGTTNTTAQNQSNSAITSLQEAAAKIDELEAQLLTAQEKEVRLLADAQNIRRRTEEGRSTLIFESTRQVLIELILILDNFERARQNLPAELQDHEWTKGIFSIEKQISEFLKKEGVEEIAEVGVELDPHSHEAVATEAAGEPGKVSKILVKGYRFLGKVLRPAQVIVGA